MSIAYQQTRLPEQRLYLTLEGVPITQRQLRLHAWLYVQFSLTRGIRAMETDCHVC